MIPTPLIQYKFVRKNSHFKYMDQDIYKFAYIFSEYKVGRTPLERKYQNSFLCIQQLITALEINYLRIITTIFIISKVNSTNIFQSFFIKKPSNLY